MNEMIIRKHIALFDDIRNTNLPQIAEISQLMVLLTKTNADISSLLYSSVNDPDEERIYIEGRDILDVIFTFEPKFKEIINVSENKQLTHQKIYKDILEDLTTYKNASIEAIELSTVNINLAQKELMIVNQSLQQLSLLFLQLSEYHVQTLTDQSNQVNLSLDERYWPTIISASIIVLMLILAIYFSRHLSESLSQIIDALIKVSKGDKNIKLESHNDRFLSSLKEAVNKYHKTVIDLSEYKFALDQHAIVSMSKTNGEIIYANDAFIEISGYSKEELIGANHRLLNSGKHTRIFWKAMYRTIAKGKVWHGEICNRKKNGKLYWLEATIVPLMGDTGKPISYIALRTNITRLKDIEKDLLEAKERAEESNRMKSAFLTNISHEIRTPMNGILGILDLIKTTSCDKDQEHKIQLAQSSANALLAIINDILDLSKIESGQLHLEAIDFNLVTALNELIEMMALSAKKKGLNLTLDTRQVTFPMVKADRDRIRQIFTQIIANAIKFSKKGEIVVSVAVQEIQDNQLKLKASIRDSGIGIAADKLEQIFQLFNQADVSTSRKYGGTGLGLSLTRQLCELMDGSISVSSKENEGSCFSFNLKFEKGVQQKITKPKLIEKPKSKTISGVDIPPILLVEDNKVNQLVARGILKKLGFQAEVANNGQEALDMLDKNMAKKKYPAILMDCQMPILDGYDATRKIRSKNTNPAYRKIPIIALTAHAMAGEKEKCFAAGMDDFLTKPINVVRLKETLNKWVK